MPMHYYCTIPQLLL